MIQQIRLWFRPIIVGCLWTAVIYYILLYLLGYDLVGGMQAVQTSGREASAEGLISIGAFDSSVDGFNYRDFVIFIAGAIGIVGTGLEIFPGTKLSPPK